MTTKTQTADEAGAEAMNLPKVAQSDFDKARRDGMLEAAKEDAKQSYGFVRDGNLPSESASVQYPGMHDIGQYEPLLGLGVDDFTAAINEKADPVVPIEKVAGLLELERSGQNRTPYVKALVKRLGVKSPYEVTSAGPDYTNDASPVSKL